MIKNSTFFYFLTLAFAFATSAIKTNAQNVSSNIGNLNNNKNASERYQFVPKDFDNAKVQILFNDKDLTDAGIPSNATIVGLEWEVVTDGSPGTTQFDLYADAQSSLSTLPANAVFAAAPSTKVATGSDAGTLNGFHTVMFSTFVTRAVGKSLLLQLCRSGFKLPNQKDELSRNVTNYVSMVTGYNQTCLTTEGFYSQSSRPTFRFIYRIANDPTLITSSTVGRLNNNSNASESYQFVPKEFENAKVQMLFNDKDLTDAGIPGNAIIVGLEWEVVTDGSPGTTRFDLYADAQSSLTTLANNPTFATTPTTKVATSLDEGTSNGFHTVMFSTFIVRAAGKSLLLQLCRSGFNLSGQADRVSINGTSYISMITGYNQACSETEGYYAQNSRPTFRFIYSVPQVLPISLKHFTAKASSNEVSLNWTTASEQNNKEFILSRSSDGVNFNELTKIKGAGNSSENKNYFYTDRNPSSGINYYKLEQLDNDGLLNSVGMEVVNFKLTTSTVSVYPNPTAKQINLSIPAEFGKTASITIVDIIGKSVYTEKIQLALGQTSYELNNPQLPAGQYIVKISGDKKVESLKVLVK